MIAYPWLARDSRAMREAFLLKPLLICYDDLDRIRVRIQSTVAHDKPLLIGSFAGPISDQYSRKDVFA